MQLKFIEALKRGVEAHKAGNFGEANRYYTSVIKSNPNHPDANHNMGVLAVGIGKFEEALPFFEKALKSNPNIKQFWLSYFNALVRLDRLGDAKALFGRVQEEGLGDDIVAALDQQLSKLEIYGVSNNPPHEKVDSLLSLYGNGLLQQTLLEAKRLLEKFPRSTVLYNILGVVSQRLEKLDDAHGYFSKALSINPDYADAYNNLGVVLRDQGKFKTAIIAYKKALSINPDYADAYNNLASLLQDQDKLDEAIEAYRKVLSINPKNANVLNNLGSLLQRQEKFEEAIVAYTGAINLRPDHHEAYNNIALSLKNEKKFDDAITNLKKAISLKPDFAEAYNNMGNILQDQGKFEEAQHAYTKALSIKPNFAEVYSNLGGLFTDLGKSDEALDNYQKALSFNSELEFTHKNISVLYAEMGKLKDARNSVLKALKINPKYAEAHRILSTLSNYNLRSIHLRQLEDLYNNATLSDDDTCSICFALAKAHDDCGSYQKAINYLNRANKIRKSILNYSIKSDEEIFSQLKVAHKAISNSKLILPKGSSQPVPIFILGMPRSGTTLVEQVVSSHSKVTGAGELNYVHSFGETLSLGLIEPIKVNILQFRERYLSSLTSRSEGKRFVTDKMPGNFKYLPLICSALPEAKIVHVQRDARATCWSNYRHYFWSSGNGYCYSLADVVSYYKLYRNIFKIWDNYYGDRIYELSYEKLTINQQAETEKLIEYLGLEWDKACLEPHKNNRSVKTASLGQVRKKIYKGSSESWQNYLPYLRGVFNKLEILT